MRQRFSPGWMVLAGLAAMVVTSVGRAAGPQIVQAPEPGDRLAEMRHHFLQVTLVHEAVVRGDLPATREPATELSALPTPAGLRPGTEAHVDAIRAAGRQVMMAATLQDAARPAAAMLTQCGACHRASGVFPTPSNRPSPDVGGIVGHMLEHQRAVDRLLQGIVIPSESRWQEGARLLTSAPMARADLPPDHGLTPDVRGAEAEVHALAERAAAATSPDARTGVFVDLTMTCARCHGLHQRIWGPATNPAAEAGR